MDKKQKKAIVRKAAKDERRRKIAEYKELLGCADCGQRFPACAMDFDHRDRHQKEFSIGRNVGHKSEDTLWLEIYKCDVVCAICHRIRTSSKKEWYHVDKSP